MMMTMKNLPMTFIWPDMLWGLIALPLLVLLYVWLQRRRKKTTLRYANLGLVREALGKSIAWRRHLPPVDRQERRSIRLGRRTDNKQRGGVSPKYFTMRTISCV